MCLCAYLNQRQPTVWRVEGEMTETLSPVIHPPITFALLLCLDQQVLKVFKALHKLAKTGNRGNDGKSVPAWGSG